MRKRKSKVPAGVTPVDLDAIQDQRPDPQESYDNWCAEQDRQWRNVIDEWGNVP